jgi:opacity protein-like surface antigen
MNWIFHAAPRLVSGIEPAPRGRDWLVSHFMGVRTSAVLGTVLFFAVAGGATAAQSVQPRANTLLRGEIQFPRAQGLYLQTGAKDGARVTLALGFHGRCKGGGLAELWSANVAARPVLRVRDGRFSGTLTGVARNLGGVSGREGRFTWTVSGRFTERTVAVGTVSGTAEVRVGGKTVSRCRTSKPATFRAARA